MLNSRVTLTATMLMALLGGCSAGQATSPIAANAPAPTTSALASLTARALLDITGPTGYHVTSQVTAWRQSDVNHVLLTLLKDSGNGTFAATGATKSVASAALSTALTLQNLRYGTTYKVSAKAFGDAAETVQIDSSLDTGNDAANSTSFTTPALVTAATGDSANDSSVLVTIPVHLRNKIFAGQASQGSGATGVTVTNGTIVNTTSPESF